MNPSDHIKRIRKHKFGLSTDGQVESQNALSGDLQAATENLTSGLYSKDIHFILELIQNAEDNEYALASVPDLTFILLDQDPTNTFGSDGALMLINNEKGFSEEHVDALCSIGKTTKEKQQGYIGEKGIGFKSVFLVSTSPHLYSNGYRFCFREEPDPAAGLGYIVPYWVEAIPSVVQPHTDSTCILLPLKHGKKDAVRQQLLTIAPDTLLFLSKLQALKASVEGEMPIRVRRVTIDLPRIRIFTDGDHSDFWVANHKAGVLPDLKEEKRIGITSRVTSVALPLTGKVPVDQIVFAYLPTEEHAGFPFLINADFILTTSREHIKFGLPWNQWMRDTIAPTFEKAFGTLLLDSDLRHQAYAYIPLTVENRLEFFQPVVDSIHQLFRESDVVLTNVTDLYARPTVCRLATKPFRDIINDSDGTPSFLEHTHLVHPKIEIYSRQLRAIGVSTLSDDEVLLCLQDDKWMDAQSPQWYKRLCEYLSGEKWATADRLAHLRLIVTSDSRRTNAAAQPLYFPISKSDDLSRIISKLESIHPVAFMRHEWLESTVGNGELLAWISDTLLVSEFTISQYCVDLVVRLNGNRDSIQRSDLLLATTFVRDLYDKLDDMARKAIISNLPLITVEGALVVADESERSRPIVMPKTMDPEVGWQRIFPESNDYAHMQILSDEYIADNVPNDRENWRIFFRELGVTSVPYPSPARWDWRFHLPENMGDLVRANLNQEIEYSTRVHTYKDWLAPSWLNDRIEPGEPDDVVRGRSNALLNYLEQQRINNRGPLQAYYSWFYYYRHSKEYPSDFKHHLLRAAWFPSTKGYRRPPEIFIDKPEIREIFGDTIPYALENPSQKVSDALNMRQIATADEIIRFLGELASQPAENIDRHQVLRVYEFLHDRWRSELLAEFKSKQLILIGKPKVAWTSISEVVWPDYSDAFGDAHFYLENQYPETLRDFFIENLGVAEHLDDTLYRTAWEGLADQQEPDAEVVERALRRIYPTMVKFATSEKPPAWWSEFSRNAKVWTTSRRFASANSTYIPDDGDLARLFSERSVSFAWVPTSRTMSAVEPLLKALCVKSVIDEHTATSSVFNRSYPSPDDWMLNSAAKRAICQYLWNLTPDTYRRLKNDSVLDAFLSTSEVVGTDLTIVHHLGGTSVADNEFGAFWDIKEKLLYLSATSGSDRHEVDIPPAISRKLAPDGKRTVMEDFVGRVLSASDGKVDQIIRKKNWSMPDEESEWIEAKLATQRPPPIPDPPPPEPPTKTPPPPQPPVPKPSQRRKAKPRPRIRSYVEPGVDEESGNEGSGTRRGSEIEQAAVDAALNYEKSNDRIAIDLNKNDANHKGWDLESYVEDPVAVILNTDNPRRIERRIEVKGLEGAWDGWGVGLTSSQHDAAIEYGDGYFIYVIEYAQNDHERKLYVIRDPAKKIVSYRFDESWLNIADETAEGELLVRQDN